MKKFLKRAVAVLLTVCLMASVLVPVSAIEISGTPTSQTKTYNFTTGAGYPKTPAGSTVHSSTDGSSSFYCTRSLAANASYIYQGNFKANTLVLKLNGIPASADGKYTLSVKTGKSSSAVLKIYLLGSYTFESGSSFGTDKKDIGTIAAGTTSVTTTITDVELGDYLSDGSVYILLTENSGGNAFYLASVGVTYNENTTQSVPAATVEQVYDYSGYGADTGNVFGTNKNYGYEATNTKYADGEKNWAPVAEYDPNDDNGQYSRYSDDIGGILVRAYDEGWIALKIKSPGVAGEYSISVDTYDGTSAYAGSATFYIMAYDSSYANDEATWSAITSAITNDNKLYKKESVNFTSGGTLDLGSFEFAASTDYLVVFYAGEDTTSYMGLQRLTLSREVLEMPDLSNATKFDQIKLAYNHTGDLDVGGASVDLNGYTVSGEIKSTNGNGIVTNSTNGTAYLPLNDGSDYKYYTYTTTTTFSGTNPYQEEDAAYFWFDINFDDAAAYDLIKTGNSGLTISAELVLVQAGVEAEVAFDTTVTKWAAAQNGTDDIAMGVQVTGLSTIEGSETIGMVFKYEAGNTSGTIGSGLSFEVNN